MVRCARHTALSAAERFPFLRLGTVLAVLLSPSGTAFGQLTLSGSVAELAGADWRAQQIDWVVVPNGESSVNIGTLGISNMPASLSEISLRCANLGLASDAGSCAAGELTFRLDERPVQGRWDASFSTSSSESRSVPVDGSANVPSPDPFTALQASLTIALAGGEVSVEFKAGTQPTLTARATGLRLDELLSQLPVALPAGLTALQGDVAFDLAATLGSNLRVSGGWTVGDLGFDSLDGGRAGAGLALRGDLVLESDEDNGLTFEASAVIEGGELLVDPAYLSFSELPDVELTLAGRRNPAGTTSIDRWQISDGDSVTVSGEARLAGEGTLELLTAQLDQFRLAEAYPRFLSAAGESFGLEEVEASGEILGGFRVENGAMSHVSLIFETVDFISNQEHFGASRLRGFVDYSLAGDSADSSLSWDSLRYYTLLIGAADSRFFAGGRQVLLLDPLFLPVLNGGLQVDELALNDLGTDQVAMDFRGELKPVALDQITRALDWPVLNGTLGGTIPQIRLRNQVVEVGGNVVVDVFGGTVTMEQLRLERLFGVLPTLSANVQIEDIDLEQMTGAFSFGKIEGVLRGSVDGLRLLNWRPVAFDLDLHTDPDAGVRQRISQRAVDNLSSIGGGAAALGSTVLKIFDDFGYQQLGLTCVLRNNTCDMGGVGDAGNGYFLVRGSGIPRIDIKGFSRRVDWPQLVRRLQAATESGPASVE
ncbi:MAG: hypothetical protein AAGB27_07995 [Pseudomonadota bacterium]